MYCPFDDCLCLAETDSLRHSKLTVDKRVTVCYLHQNLLSLFMSRRLSSLFPQLGAADAEIKVPSGENTELKRSPFKAWSKSVYSHTRYAYCQGFLLVYFYTSSPFTCIFSKTSPDFSLCWLWLTHGSCVGPQNKIGHPAGCRFPYWVPAEYK